jgi:hypothetical protein
LAEHNLLAACLLANRLSNFQPNSLDFYFPLDIFHKSVLVHHFGLAILL